MFQSFWGVRSFAAIALISSILFLAACSQTSKPITTIDTGTLVELDLTFGNLGEGLSTQGIPFESGTTSVTRFEIQVFDDNNTLVTFDADNRIDPTGSVDTLAVAINDSVAVALSTGDYSFKSKAFAPHKIGGAEVLLAVGKNAETINVDTTATTLDVQTITESFTFQNNTPLNYIMPGQTLDMMLVVTAPGGYLVPLADYDVNYTIDMDNVSAHIDSVRGTRLTVKDPLVDNDISVVANITGISADGSSVSLPTIDGVLDIPFLTSGVGPVYDTEAPTFTFVKSALKLGQATSLTGTADDNIGVAKVQVYDGPVLLGSSDSAEAADANVALISFSGTTWTMNFIPTVEDYDFFAVAIDTSGNQSSAGYTITIQDFAFTSVRAGNGHTCAVGNDGQAYCWGLGDVGQLGGGISTQVNTPVAVTAVVGVSNWQSIGTGYRHTCGLGDNGQAYCWGHNQYGELGIGTNANELLPAMITNPVGVNSWKSINLSSTHVCAIGNDDQVYCWGAGGNGGLGTGSNTNSNIPVAITKPAGINSWKSIDVGSQHSCGISNDDQIYCWGLANTGQLGTGSNANSNIPLPIIKPAGVNGWKSVSLGSAHSCAITDNDQAYCWGDSHLGQIGGGTTANSNIPVAVTKPANITLWKDLAIEGYVSCAIGNDDQAYCWGAGSSGQLGRGSTTISTTPVTVTNPTEVNTWKSINVGGAHTCGIGNNNQTYCWGYGGQGRLGIGNNNLQLLPVAVINP